MMKGKIILMSLLLFFSFLLCNKRRENCKKFRTGVFYSQSLNNINYYHIFRKNDRQVEIDKEGNESNFFLKWDKECSYTVIPQKENINKPDSIRIEIIRIIHDTAYYDSKVYFKNDIYEVSGRKMIRIGEVPD